MADVAAVTTPVSDDVELEDILRRSTSEIPTVVVRKDSNSAPATEALTGADDGARLCTPAPMATFEMLSDVEESDMDDISSLGTQRDGVTLDAESHVKSLNDDTVSDFQTNGTVYPPPPPEVDNAMDLSDTQNALEEHNNVDLTASEHAASQDWSSEPMPAAAGVPTLVFEDIDAGKPTNLSSPDECLVNNDDDNDVSDDTQQQMWQWTDDQDQEASWITFDEDQTVPSFQEDEEQKSDEADDEEEEEDGEDAEADEADGKDRPERPPPPSEQQKSRDEIAKERALAKYSAQLEQEAALEEDDNVPFTDKKKSKIKLPFSTKKIMKNVGLKDKDKTSKEKSSSRDTSAVVRPVSHEPLPRVQHTPSAEVQAKMQDSEEWKAFQAMQERISQVVSQTSEKVSQMEQGFETDLLSKLTATQTTSPWSVMGVDGAAPSPPIMKSPGDQEDQKNLSWVGFEDKFEAETAEDTAAVDADEQPPDVQQVNSNQQAGEQVSQFDDSWSSAPPDVVTSAPPPPDVITQPIGEQAPAEPVAMVTNDAAEAEKEEAMISAKQEEPEPEIAPITSESQVATETVEATDTVDPFDVSNVVSAITSGKPIFEVLPSEDTSAAPAKQQVAKKTAEERRERDRQIFAAMIGADDNEATGARSRPRPRPQAAVKSANPFKITMAASNIEPASLDDDADDDADDYNQTTTTTFSAANPFARADFDDSETAVVDSGIWDPFSGADATTFTATFEFDDHTDDATNHDLTKTRDKDAESQSSKSSFEEPEEALEPLDPFYPPWDGKGGWNMFLRTPLKKKLTQNRAWKPVFVRLCEEKDAARVRVYTSETESTCLHEMTLGPTFALREMQLQQFDQYTKCHTVKLEHVFYVEKLALKSDRIAPTLRDVTKVRDLKGLKDLVHKPKTTMLLSHSPQATESLKFGTLDLVAYKQFIRAIEDIMFVQKAPQRGRVATSYTKDEIIVDLIDEYYADIDYSGHISYHKARVRLFCLTFLTGNPMVEIGINDKKRRGNEIVGRADIIPIKTEDWIRYEDVQLHDIIDKEEYEKSRLIKCRPPDGSRFEVMRFRVRPRVNVELPLQIGVQMSVVDRHIEIRADVMIPGYFSTSRRASQVACENIQIRFPIPEALVYMFRVEKRFRYGSVHSSRKKPGRIKGLERLTMFATGGGGGGSGVGGGAAGNAIPGSTPIVLQASSGLAKYEHLHRAIVWRISRLPERNQGAYKTHLFLLKLEMGPHDTPPTEYAKHIHVEYTLANSLVSRAQVRSISLSGQYYEEPPDRWVRHLARYEYTVEVEFTDQLRAPTQTEAPDLDDIFSTSRQRHEYDDDDAGATPGSATASGSESTADESSDSSDSD